MIKLSKACLLLVYLDFLSFISTKRKGNQPLVTCMPDWVCQVGVGWVTFLRENKDPVNMLSAAAESLDRDGAHRVGEGECG